MASTVDNGASWLPLIVITGPTASGKTAASIAVAQKYGGEIICADSRTVYKGLDIGTAKPTMAERAGIPHYLLDVVNPDEQYNVSLFQTSARALIADIRSRGKLPVMVGGSGLYVDSVVLDYDLGSEPDVTRRAELEQMTLEALYDLCKKNNINLPSNYRNKRYVIRAIEQEGRNPVRKPEPDDNTYVVGIATESHTLKERIKQRSERMFEEGLLAEAKENAAVYGWNITPLRAPEYDAARRLIINEITRDAAIEHIARAEWQLARKQMTWLRRNQWVHWLPLEHVDTYVHQILTREA